MRPYNGLHVLCDSYVEILKPPRGGRDICLIDRNVARLRRSLPPPLLYPSDKRYGKIFATRQLLQLGSDLFVVLLSQQEMSISTLV